MKRNYDLAPSIFIAQSFTKSIAPRFGKWRNSLGLRAGSSDYGYKKESGPCRVDRKERRTKGSVKK